MACYSPTPAEHEVCRHRTDKAVRRHTSCSGAPVSSRADGSKMSAATPVCQTL
jgi:hypothetical protein